MKKVLIGMVCDGTAGGVDKYILNFYRTVHGEDVQIDFLTNVPDNPLLERLGNPDSKIYCVSGLFHPLRQYKEIKQVLKNGYDVLYLNVSTALPLPAFLAAKHCGIKKIIAHSHSSGYDCTSSLKRKLMTLLHRLCKKPLCRCATDYLSCSDKAAEWMFTNRVVKSDGVQIIKNTIDISLFHFDEQKRSLIRKELNIEDRYVVGYVGNLVYPKNPLFLIEMFNKAAAKDPDAVLVIAGDGLLRPSMQELVEKYSLRDRVIFLGRVDMSRGYMSAFDVFALPSRFEGMPIVGIEAQCSKLPCVFSTNITTMAKISNMCDFVPTDSAEEFATAVLKWKNTDRSEHKLTVVSEDFSLEAQADILKNVIQ